MRVGKAPETPASKDQVGEQGNTMEDRGLNRGPRKHGMHVHDGMHARTLFPLRPRRRKTAMGTRSCKMAVAGCGGGGEWRRQDEDLKILTAAVPGSAKLSTVSLLKALSSKLQL